MTDRSPLLRWLAAGALGAALAPLAWAQGAVPSPAPSSAPSSPPLCSAAFFRAVSSARLLRSTALSISSTAAGSSSTAV